MALAPSQAPGLRQGGARALALRCVPVSHRTPFRPRAALFFMQRMTCAGEMRSSSTVTEVAPMVAAMPMDFMGAAAEDITVGGGASGGVGGGDGLGGEMGGAGGGVTV